MIITLLIVVTVLLVCFFAKNWLVDRFVQACYFLARCWFRAKRKRLQVGNIDWCYLDAGTPDKPIMLLIHGFGVDKYNWLPYLPELAKDFHIIVPDLPGFGETTFNATVKSFAVDQQVERLRQFIQGLKLESFHLAGNSMGGLIAGMYCVDSANAVKTLALMDAAGLAADKETFLLTSFEQGEFKLIPRTVEESQEVINKVMAHPPKIPRFFLSYMLRKQEERREMLETIYKLVVGYQRDAILQKELHKLTMPVLVIWGKEDQLLDVSGGENAMPLLVNGRLVVLDDVGHGPMAESPAITAKHHKQFIYDNN